MNYVPIAKDGIRNAVITSAYIAVVATLMSSIGPKMNGGPEILLGLMMLLLFVVSALITGSLVLWQPAKLFLEGKKTEAGALLGFTGGTMFLMCIALGTYLVTR